MAKALSGFVESSDAVARVGRRALRSSLADTIALVHQHGAVEVTNENLRDVVLVDGDLYDEMLTLAKAALRMRDGLRLAATAASSGVALPGELMASLGLEVDEDALKRFRSAYPANITHDETGAPLPPLPTVEGEPLLFADDEDDLVFTDD